MDRKNRIEKLAKRIILESKFGGGKEYVQNLIDNANGNTAVLYFDLKEALGLIESQKKN